MSDSLGLSIGVANLVAARVGSAPVIRRSVLTLFGDRAPIVGVPAENPNLTEPGVVVHGFVEGLGHPAPLVASDGSRHRSEALTVEALDAMARTVGYGAPVAMAVPAHWGQDQVATLRDALRAEPALAPGDVPPALTSDATAALAALYAKPGFPIDGVVALCDFGASGTSITLTDAASNFRRIGETVRYTDFSGDLIDQAILNRLDGANSNADNPDAQSTRPIGSPGRRLDECRRAKEQLSAATVAVVPAEMPGYGEDVRLSRTELEDLISEPLDRFVDTFGEILRRNGVPTGKLAATATVGGGACIPLVTKRLEDRLQVPVVTTPQPLLSSAIGAAVLAEQRTIMSAPTEAVGNIRAHAPSATGLDAAAPTASDAAVPAGMDDARTELASSAWAAEAARYAAEEAHADGAQSATYRALAWSQDPSAGGEPLPYTGEDHVGTAPERLPWYKRGPVLFTLAAAAALVAMGGAGVLAFKLSATHHGPPGTTTSVTPPSRPPASQPAPPPPMTVTVTGPDSSTEESTITPAPPPPTETTAQPPVTTTTTQPPVATTYPSTTYPTTTTPYPPITTTPPVTTRPVIPIFPGPTTPTYAR
jgi:hypothetical protein